MAVARSTAVGGFVLGALALAVAAIVLLAGQNLFARKLRVVAYFDNSVAGLVVGAPVTLRGVKIGTVESMKVYLKLPDLVPVIPVYMEIEPKQVSWTKDPLSSDEHDLETAVKAGLRAQLATQSLVTGQVMINLDFHPETQGKLVGGNADALEIPTIPSDMQHIKDELADLKLAETADKARAALDVVTRVLGELTGKMGPLADSLKQTSDDARVTLDTTTAAVQKVQQDASHTLGSIDHLATTTEAELGSTIKNVDQAVATLNRTVSQAEKVMDNLHDITNARAPLRGDLEAAVRDLAASTASLRNFSREIERNPSSLLLGGLTK